MIEQRWGTRDMTKLGGMATSAPRMAIALVIISFANIAMPLTNGFIGEFMLFNGLFSSASAYRVTFMVVAGLGVILGAVSVSYTHLDVYKRQLLYWQHQLPSVNTTSKKYSPTLQSVSLVSCSWRWV